MSEDVEQMEAMLRLMFGDHYVSMFHVIRLKATKMATPFLRLRLIGGS